MIKKWIFRNADMVVLVGSFPIAFVVGIIGARIFNGYWGPSQGWFQWFMGY